MADGLHEPMPDAAEPQAGPLRRFEQTWKAPDGSRLFRRSWVPAGADRVALLVHGYAEHSGRYEGIARWLAARGVAVHAYDHRGHGRSEGRRGHVRSFEEFLDDLDGVLAEVRREHGGLPLYLIGHSMGGLISLAYLVERQPVLHGAVSSGAAVSVEALPPSRIRMARLLRKVLPTMRMPSGLDLEGLSRDPAVLEAYTEDPFVFRDMTLSLGAELIEAALRTAPRGAEVSVPLLVLHGAEDPICDPAGSRRFADDVRATGSELRIYEGLRHEIFNEPEKEEVYTDVWRWIEGLS